MGRDYDLAILGSGAAAFGAAIRAKEQGLSTVMVERGTVGGTCVNIGCVPSKALLAAAKARHHAVQLPFPGVPTSAGPVDLAALMASKDALVTDLRARKYVDLAKELGVEVVPGEGRFVEGPAVVVGDRRIEAEQYLVATGAVPFIPPIRGIGDVDFLTSTTAMDLTELPESLVIVGGNYVGLELGQLFLHLGSRVTLVEQVDRIAPQEEPEVSTALTSVLRDEGMEIHSAAELVSVEQDGADVVCHIRTAQGDKTVTAARLLIAAGRRPSTATLGVDEVGVELGSKGEIVVDDTLCTTQERIWAAGDVTGHPQFVYVAARHGALVVDNAFGKAGHRVDYDVLPRVTFTSPTVAAVGMTEEEALSRGHQCECRVLTLEHVPRALVERDLRGVVKLVAEEDTGRLLGVHMVAEGAGDVALAATYALKARLTVAEVADTWAPYLTMGEALRLCAQSFTRPVEELSCCAG